MPLSQEELQEYERLKAEIPPDVLQSFGIGLSQGATFGFADEAKSALQAISPDITYDDALTKNRERLSAARKEHPYATGTGEVTGAIGTAIAGGALGAGGLIAGSTIPRAAGVGALSGGLYGFGTGENGLAERLEGSVVPAVLGAGFGAGGAALSRSVGRAVSRSVNRSALKKPVASGQAIPYDNATEKVIQKLRADYPDPADFDVALQQFISSPEAMLAEVGKTNIQRQARGAAQFPAGEKAAREGIYGRLGGTPVRITKKLGKYLSKNADYYGTIDDIFKKGRAKAAPLYDKAYAANKAVKSKEIDKILETPAGKKALAGARTIMQNDRSLMGLPDKELGELARDLERMGLMSETKGGVASGLSLRSLDYVKRALDDQYEIAARAGEKANASAILGLKKSLVSALDDVDKSGTYAKARSISGDYLSNVEALESGRNFNKLDPELIAKQYKNMGEAQKESFKAGMLRQISDTIHRRGDNFNAYNAVFGNAMKRKQLKAVMSDEEFSALQKAMTAEDKLYDLRNFVLGNSSTAGKQIDAMEFDQQSMEMLASVAQKGWTNTAGDEVIKMIRKAGAGLSDKSAKKVADILFETDPVKKLAIAKSLKGAVAIPKSERSIALKTYFLIDESVNKFIPQNTGSVASGAAASTVTQPLRSTENK